MGKSAQMVGLVLAVILAAAGAARQADAANQGRSTPNSIQVRRGTTPSGPAKSIETAHLTLTAALSDEEAAPDERFSIVLDVEPRRGMHVYAPGKHTYQAIGLSLDQQPWLRSQPMTYPAPEIYHFKPLNERVEVYTRPFRLIQDISIPATPDVRKQLASRGTVTIAGRVTYQACDDKLCYSPQSLPVSWTLTLKRVAR